MHHAAPHARAARALILIAAVASAVGCEEGETMRRINADPEARRVAAAVDDLNENSADGRRVAGLFAAGKGPKGEPSRNYARYAYFATQDARVAGDSATMTVSLREAQTSRDVGTQDWTFKKEGDVWKIDSAPLP